MKKLNADTVRAIRLAYDTGSYTYHDLAAEHDITRSMVGQIVTGASWKNVEPSRCSYRRGRGRPAASLMNAALTIEQLRYAHTLWRGGMSLRNVAQVMSTPLTTLYRRLVLFRD